MSIETLRTKYPFPEKVDHTFRRHTIKGRPLGWACEEIIHSIYKYGPKAKVVLDGGSFQGLSATHFVTLTPADVICIDHWQGSVEHQKREDVQELYQIFLANVAEHAARIIPMRMNSLDGMREVAAHGVKPDVILIDWSHDMVSVRADVGLALDLFPEATLILDDWRRKGVKEGAEPAAAERNRIIIPLIKTAVIEGKLV